MSRLSVASGTSGRPIDTLLPRLDHVKSSGASRWMARCPAHEDRGPSLSVRDTSEGTVLLKCFAGCNAVDVLRALNLTLKDLFAAPQLHRASQPVKRQATSSEIDKAVSAELALAVATEGETLGFEPAVLTRHIASARRRVGVRFNVKLDIPAPQWWECEPHCTDPLWRAAMRHAIRIRAARCEVTPAFVNERASKSPRVADSIINAATDLMRAMALRTVIEDVP